MPAHFHNVVFTGGNVTMVEGNQHIASQPVDEGMRLLYTHAAPAALHDSGERFNAPNCHPNTRVAVKHEIMDWLNDEESEYVAMWVKGAMGAGKSAISQAIAQLCHDRGLLSSSFFFSRGSSSGRNDHMRVVATLAYEMSREIPDTKKLISVAIMDDHLVFESSLKHQLEKLIIGSLIGISPSAGHNKPRLIIIDGLDECASTEAQSFLVNVFVSTFARVRHELGIPHKILIASRPETVIEAAFRDPSVFPFVRQLPLDNSWSPDADIKNFLLDSFVKIKRTHPLGGFIPDRWPPVSDVDKLVQKSSGQFIYSAVVIKFIQSPRNHPIQSLRLILGLVKNTKSRPYAELDALYAHIFSEVDDIEIVLRILCLHDISAVCGTSIHDTETFLDIPQGMVMVAVNDLASILKITSNAFGRYRIAFLHASLPEYLIDKSRSGEYYIYGEELCQGLAQRCLDVVAQEPTDAERYSAHYQSTLFVKPLIEKLTTGPKTGIYEAISNIDIMARYQSMISDSSLDVSLRYLLHDSFGYFIQWILSEHKKFDTSIADNPLARAFEKIQSWIFSHFKVFPSSGFDNPKSRDLWIFACDDMCYFEARYRNVDLISRISALTSGREATLLRVGGVDSVVAPSMEACWCLLGYLSRNAAASDESLDALLGEYAFTGERYLKIVVHILEDVDRHQRSKWINEHYLPLIKFFLRKAPPDKKLCDLLKATMVGDADSLLLSPLSDGASRAYVYFRKRSGRRRTALGSYYSWGRLIALVDAFDDYIKKASN